MNSFPNPAQVAAKFRPRVPALPKRRPAPAPHGWRDDVSLPPKNRHFYLDTGIFHSLAGVDEGVREKIVPFIDQHERNATILSEVLNQTNEPLYTLRLDIWKVTHDCARDECKIKRNHGVIETIRSELIADSQLRHPHAPQATNSRDKHGGEAELIHVAELHSPKGAIICNDAGASAVANRHGVPSVHFVHLVRAAVWAGLPVDDGLTAAYAGIAVSQLAAGEKARTCNKSWLTNQAKSSS